MTTFDSERNPVEVLADEFTSRCRSGECPSVTEYVESHPDLADEIRELFPSIAMIEQLGRREHADREMAKSQTAFTSKPIERIGDFRIVREIGRGGMGVVYEAVQESLGRRVAVKVLTASAVSSPRQLQRFQREAQAAASLHHSNIVPVFGVGEDDGLHYYVMQVIDGVGLDVIVSELRRSDTTELTKVDGSTIPNSGSAVAAAQALRVGHFSQSRSSRSENESKNQSRESTVTLSDQSNRASQVDKVTADADTECLPNSLTTDEAPMPDTTTESVVTPHGRNRRIGDRYWKSVARVGVQLADAIQYAHGKGVLHRDIKPSNLLLDNRGTVWITDFGLAKHTESDDLTNTGDIIGTLKYMAPEQFDGQSSAMSDIYSLGLTLYELTTLESAVNESDRNRVIRQILEGEPVRPRRLNSRIPLDLETIVLKSIARNPAHRYATAGDLADDLQRFLDDEPIQARRVTTLRRLSRWCKRNPAVATWAGIALSLLVLVAVVASFGYLQTTEALKRETAERQKSEATLEISLDALDKVYERFAPDRFVSTTHLTIEDEEGSEIEVSAPAVLSQQTAEILESMLDSFDRFAELDSDNIKLRREAAKANRRVGDIHQQLGQFAQAQTAYRRAIARYEELDRDPLVEGDCRIEVARIQNELGNIFRAQREFRKAQASFDEALDSLRMIVATPAPPREARFELARSCYLLGMRPPDWLGFGSSMPMPFGNNGSSRGQSSRGANGESRSKNRGSSRRPEGKGAPSNPFGERDGHLKRAIDLLEKLNQEFPNTAEYQHLLALCCRDRFSRNNSSGIDKAIEILQTLSDEYRNAPAYRFELSSTYAMSAFRFTKRDDDQSLSPVERLEKAIEISEHLVAENPHVPRYTSLHTNNCSKMAMTLRWQSKYSPPENPEELLVRAEQFHREALAGLTPLVDRFPDALIYKISLAKSQESLADFIRRYRSTPESLAEARSLLDSSIASLSEPSDDEWDARMLKCSLAKSYITMSEILRELGEKEKADEFAKKALPFRSFGSGSSKWRGGRRDRRDNDDRSKKKEEPDSSQPPTVEAKAPSA